MPACVHTCTLFHLGNFAFTKFGCFKMLGCFKARDLVAVEMNKWPDPMVPCNYLDKRVVCNLDWFWHSKWCLHLMSAGSYFCATLWIKRRVTNKLHRLQKKTALLSVCIFCCCFKKKQVLTEGTLQSLCLSLCMYVLYLSRDWFCGFDCQKDSQWEDCISLSLY